MKTFEQMKGERVAPERLPEMKAFEATEEGVWNTLLEGQKPTAEHKLTFAHGVRERIFDSLTELGKIRERQRQIKTEAFQTLRFMIQNGYLNERGKGDANVFLAMDDVVKDEALSQIAFLCETDQDIASFEREAGYTDEEIDARARVRRQYASAFEAEWGVS